ncbi:MAG TPA: NAD(P)/FAD-dependent oxidoreductase [Ktedonobacteraceae bacterium]|jgi:NADH dehydrogenase
MSAIDYQQKSHTSKNQEPLQPVHTLPHVVIVGAGFGGLEAARALAKQPVRVTVIDRRNHHLFQPLLYQVATAGLSGTDITSPVRHILSDQPNTETLMAEVKSVDTQRQMVHISDMLTSEANTISYDYLIIATGSQENYFGHDEWKTLAPSLKSIEDAIEIRRRILLAFESAELEPDPEKRQALLTFVLIGGGPTGVELAGAIAELARRSLAREFRNIHPEDARITLVEGEPQILASFPRRLAQKAEKELTHLGVDVRMASRVESIEDGAVVIAGERLVAKTILWTAGVRASDAGRWLGALTDRAGRVLLEPDLTVPGHPNIFVVGDTAGVRQRGKPLPGLAPVAIQEGRYAASAIARQVAGKQPPRPFHYFNKGNLATVGRSFGIVDIGPIRTAGFFAWILWLVVHIFFLVGFRNRVSVLLQWAWSYLTFQRGARLITFDYLLEEPEERRQWYSFMQDKLASEHA